MTYPTFQFVGNHIFYTTLDGNITGATDPIYVVDNSAAEDAPGLLKVENEIIYYGVKGSNQFSNLIRGYGGTVATGHASGVEVCHPFACDTFQKIWDGIESLKSEDISIAGVKTFSSFPITPSSVPTTDYQVANKKYVDITETTITSSSTPTPVRTGQRSFYSITALAEAATFAAPSGTPANGDMLLIRIKDNGTARALTWNAIYDGLDDTLPSTTTINMVMYILFIYNSASSKWEMLSVKVDA